MEKHEEQAAYARLRVALNERQWRLYVAVEAKKIGRGGISTVARAAQTTRGTIRKGIAELERGAVYVAGIGCAAAVGGGSAGARRIPPWSATWRPSWIRRGIR